MAFDFIQMVGVGSLCMALVIIVIQRRAADCPDHSTLAGAIAWFLAAALLAVSGWAFWYSG